MKHGARIVEVAGTSPATTYGLSALGRGNSYSVRKRTSRFREFLILRLCPLRGGPVHEPGDIVRELLALRNHLEHRAPSQIRSDDDIRSGEPVAHQERPRRHGICDYVHRGIEI